MVRRWKVPIHTACISEPWFFLRSFFCCHVSSYKLRKMVLQDDMTLYQCCQGYGRFINFNEQRCPDLCLLGEVSLCFVASVFGTRWYIQDKRNLKNSKFEVGATGLTVAATYASTGALCCNIPALDIFQYASDVAWCCLCACAQTQHYIELTTEDVPSRMVSNHPSFKVKHLMSPPSHQESMNRGDTPIASQLALASSQSPTSSSSSSPHPRQLSPS